MKIRWVVLTAIIILAVLLAACSSGIISAPSSTGTPDAASTATPQPSLDLSYLASSDPAEVDNSNLPITSVDQLHTTGAAPEVNITDYRLTVDGLVETPLTLTYAEIVAYPNVTEVVLLICPLTFVDNAEWTGVPVSTLLAAAGLKSGATTIEFQSLDGYQIELPLEDVQKDGVFLAYKVDGQMLPAEHGYPLRLVVEGQYGSNWVKWITHIEIT
jgi:DMSO/TMAO reductase YedYZ molybdopterin-dependent catalytic subunit